MFVIDWFKALYKYLFGGNSNEMFSTESWPTKTTTERLDYMIDWSARLKGDQIIDSVFTVLGNTSLTVDSSAFSNTTSTVWLEGGDSGTTVQVHNVITTIGSRIHELIVSIQVRD